MMKQLLTIEFYKLKKLSSLKAILLVYMLAGPLWMYVYSLFMQKYAQFAMFFGSADKMFGFPEIWNFTTWCMGCFNVLLGVSVVIITCNEINFRTMRQNVIDGLSKGSVIFSRFLVIFSLSLIVTVYTFLLAFVLGAIYSDIGKAGENIHFILVYFLQTLGYFSVAFLLASVIRKPALAIILFVFIFPLEGFGSLFLPYEVRGFLPLRSMSGLTPLPFPAFNSMLDDAAQKAHKWIMPVWMYVLTASAYIALIFSFTYYLLKKRDL